MPSPSTWDTESWFRLLAEVMPQIVCVLTPGGTAEYVNPTWIAFCGMDLEATRAAGWRAVVHPEDMPEVRAA